MAKLNYANRKSEGMKLAGIVAKDLRKKASSSPSKSDNSPVELNLDNKCISDEGLREISTALVEALLLAHAQDRPSCQLGELNLRNNRVTASGLQHLVSAIRLAGPWLKDVDLSSNAIEVRSPEEITAWEQFLDAFGTCRKLRRLDLSGNDFSGTHAFEVLTRVYFRHAPYDPAAARSATVAADDIEDNGIDKITTATKSMSISGSGYGSYHEGCGLRYVPYIVIDNVNMEDSGCLQLSYVVSRHVEPSYLLEPLKAGPVKQQLDDYDHRSGCSGIIYTVDQLSQYGRKLLQYCERQRDELVWAGISDEETNDSEQSSPPRDDRPPTPPSAFASMLAPRHKHGTPRRRSSLVSTESAKAAAAAAAARRGSTFDAESVRWKLQRETIEKHGLKSVELWSAAVRLLNVARAIMPSAAPPRPDSTSPCAAVHSAGLRKLKAVPLAKQIRQDSGISADELKFRTTDDRWRDPLMPFQLPRNIWRRILASAVGSRGLLSEAQIDNVLAYAADRSTLVRERENVRNPVSNQKWMVVDAMECLAYEMPL